MSTKKTTTKQAPEASKPHTKATKKAPVKKAVPQATDAKAAEPKAKQAPPKADGKLSALDAAAKVLAEAGEPLTSKAMIDAMATKGYWTSPGGKTPQATLYAAILREFQKKGAEARFQKTERGHFSIAGATAPAKPAAKVAGQPAAKPKAGAAQPADGTPGPQAVSDLVKS